MQDIGNSGHGNVGCENDRPTGGENARHENVTQICQKVFPLHLNCVVTLPG